VWAFAAFLGLAGLCRNLALAAAAAFAIVAHLGVLGATFATAKGGCRRAILALIVLKLVVTAGADMAGGGFAILRSKASLECIVNKNFPTALNPRAPFTHLFEGPNVWLAAHSTAVPPQKEETLCEDCCWPPQHSRSRQ
jgi:hypothetical protein